MNQNPVLWTERRLLDEINFIVTTKGATKDLPDRRPAALAELGLNLTDAQTYQRIGRY